MAKKKSENTGEKSGSRIPKGTKPNPPKTSVGTKQNNPKITTKVRGLQLKPFSKGMKNADDTYQANSYSTISFAVAATKDMSVEEVVDITTVCGTLAALVPEDSEIEILRVRALCMVSRAALAQVALMPMEFWQLGAEDACTITTTYDAADQTLTQIADALVADGTHDPPQLIGEVICEPKYGNDSSNFEQAIAIDLTSEFKAIMKHQIAYTLNKVNEVPKSSVFANALIDDSMGTITMKVWLQYSVYLKPMTSQKIV